MNDSFTIELLDLVSSEVGVRRARLAFNLDLCCCCSCCTCVIAC
jgi:hypothetical protein